MKDNANLLNQPLQHKTKKCLNEITYYSMLSSIMTSIKANSSFSFGNIIFSFIDLPVNTLKVTSDSCPHTTTTQESTSISLIDACLSDDDSLENSPAGTHLMDKYSEFIKENEEVKIMMNYS